MFDKLRNAAGLAGLVKDLPRIRARIEQVKRELEARTVDAETGGGAVRAIASGRLRIISVEVNRPMLRGLIDSTGTDDLRLAEELIAQAVNDALARAQEMVATELHNAAEELNLPIPPGGLADLLR